VPLQLFERLGAHPPIKWVWGGVLLAVALSYFRNQRMRGDLLSPPPFISLVWYLFPKRDEVTGEQRKFLNVELRDLYSLPSIINIIK
jgi:hypothetical protein